MRVIKLTIVFLISFVLFLYITFPYTILKEAISTQVSELTGIEMRIDELAVAFPLGLVMSKVSIESPGTEVLKLKKISARLNPLWLAAGQASFGFFVADSGSGELSGSGRSSLLAAASGAVLPSSISLKSNNFEVGNLINFALQKFAQSPSTNQTLAPLLKQVGLRGKLNADVELGLDSSNFADSSGDFKLALRNSELIFFGGDIPIPNQAFEKVLIQGRIANGNLEVNPATGIKSQELDIDLKGRVGLREPPQKSTLALDFSLKLDGQLKENFGWVLSAMMGATEGTMQYVISGDLERPTTQQR